MSGNTPPPGQGGWGQQPGQGQGQGGWGQQPGQGQGQGGWGQQPGQGQGQGGWGQQPGQYGPPPGQYGPPPGQYGQPPHGGPGQPPPDYAQWGPGAPGGPPPHWGDEGGRGRGGRRGLTALVIGLVIVVLLGGGAFAFYQADPFNLFRSGPQAAEALPADAVLYFGVDLDPSAEQKVAALTFLQKFPEFENATGVQDARDDVRKTIVEDALQSADCPDVTYDEDVEPWIGNKLGGAVVLDDAGEPQFMFVLETSDHDAAEAGLTALGECAGGEPFGMAPVGDYMLLAETQRLADRFAADAEKSSLADNDTFSSDIDALGDSGLATMWVDVDAALQAAGPDMLDSQEALVAATAQRFAATFRFEANSAEVVGVVFGDMPDVDAPDNQIVDLPESTALAVSIAGGQQSLDAYWDTILDSAREDGVDVDAEIADLETQTGLSLPDDLATVLGDNLMFALDSEGLTADALESEDFGTLNLGLRMTNDPGELNAVYDKVFGILEEEMSEVPFSKKDADDGIVIASNDGYADQLAGLDGGLGDSDAFTSVVDDAEEQDVVAYFNWDSIEPQILEAMQADGESQETIDNLRPLQAIGWSQNVEGDYLKMSLQISVN